MKLKRIGKSLLIHGTAVALSLSIMVGAFESFGAGDLGLPGSISVSAADAPTSGKGTFESGGNTYTYEYRTSNKGVEEFKLTSIEVGTRSVSIPDKVFVDGRYHTINTLGFNFGKYITADTLKMPNTITKIYHNAFFGCKIGTLYVSSNVKEIGGYFCGGAKKMGNVVYNGTQLESLGVNAFSESYTKDVYALKCNSKGAYTFGDWLIRYTGDKSAVSVQELGDGKKITKLGPDCFDTGNKEYNNKLESVDLTGVEVIEIGAFCSNPNLLNITGFTSVRSVADGALNRTKWYNVRKDFISEVTLGKVLLYYHTDENTIDLTGDQFSYTEYVNSGAIYECKNATTLKINPSIKKFHENAFIGCDVNNIDTIYIENKKVVFDENDQFLPAVLADSLDTFFDSKFVKNYITAKTKGVLKCLGITYYGEKGKGGVRELSSNQQFQIAYKLHEYITTNYFYDFGSSHGGLQPFLDGKSGIVCEQYSELYAYLLESAGVNAEIVCSYDRGPGLNHAWNIVEIGGKWYHCDVCWDSVNYNRGYQNTMTWFMVSDDRMKEETSCHGKWKLEPDYNGDYELFLTETTLPKCTAYLGDANGDGKRTKDDATVIQKYLLNNKDAAKIIHLKNADGNCTGKIELTDAVMAMQFATRRSVDPLKGYGNHTVKKPS